MNNQPTSSQIQATYELARERYAAFEVDTEQAISRLAGITISLHCWQGDDVGGFEDPDSALTGGIMATGNYPGKARTASELRQDLDEAYRLIPGDHRLNLHAIYLGPRRTITELTSIQPVFRICLPTMDLLCHTGTMTFANFGLNIARHVVALANILARS